MRLNDSIVVHIGELVPLKMVIMDERTMRVIELDQDAMRNLKSALEVWEIYL